MFVVRGILTVALLVAKTFAQRRTLRNAIQCCALCLGTSSVIYPQTGLTWNKENQRLVTYRIGHEISLGGGRGESRAPTLQKAPQCATTGALNCRLYEATWPARRQVTGIALQAEPMVQGVMVKMWGV